MVKKIDLNDVGQVSGGDYKVVDSTGNILHTCETEREARLFKRMRVGRNRARGIKEDISIVPSEPIPQVKKIDPTANDFKFKLNEAFKRHPDMLRPRN